MAIYFTCVTASALPDTPRKLCASLDVGLYPLLPSTASLVQSYRIEVVSGLLVIPFSSLVCSAMFNYKIVLSHAAVIVRTAGF